MNEKTKQILDNLVDAILNKDLVDRVLKNKIFTAPGDIPCNNWSLLNKMIVVENDTGDARGYRQWQEVGRFVKKGCHAFKILAPCKYIVKEEEDEDGNIIEKKRVTGYRTIPVFRYEDTDGEPLAYMAEIEKELKIKELPLIHVAEQLGVTIKAAPTNGINAGYYSPEKKEIVLCTESELTFFHELSHAVDHHITNHESGYDYDLGEVVAELSASFPASLYGKGVENIYHTRKYIEGYSKNPGQHPAIVIAKAVERVEKIYHYIESLGEPDVN